MKIKEVERMIYNLLQEYKEHLQEKYRPDTANTYYKRLCTLFEGQSLFLKDKLDIPLIIEKIGSIKHKNYFSQSKNAFLHFCKWQNVNLSAGVLERIGELEKGTRKKYRHLEVVDVKEVEEKINQLENNKLKLSYRVMIATGLRVSELAGITPKDCDIEEDYIILNIIGKGGDKQTVSIDSEEYPKIYEQIKSQIENTPQDKKLFYSAVYLQAKAKELGFKCHDLRRAFAKIEYRKSQSKSEVQKKLRHSNGKTTNIYIRSKIKL